MKWITAALLSSVLVLGWSVPSQSDDFAGLGLAFRGTPEASESRMRALLVAMGATEHTHATVGLFIFTLHRVEVSGGYAREKPKGLSVTCYTGDDPPAAKRLCTELERRYLEGP